MVFILVISALINPSHHFSLEPSAISAKIIQPQNDLTEYVRIVWYGNPRATNICFRAVKEKAVTEVIDHTDSDGPIVEDDLFWMGAQLRESESER